jgi:hypothetical protein
VDGLPVALWAIDSEAVLAPAEVGANVTVTVCAEAPALTVNEAGLTVNWDVSTPVFVMDETVSAAVPVLETVKVCVPDEPTLTFPKESEVEDSEMTGTGWTPVPDSDTVAGEVVFVAPCRIDTDPEAAPASVGVNVTVTVRLSPGARVWPVAGDAEKGVNALIVVTERSPFPVFLTWNVCCDEDPTFTFPKEREAGVAVKAPAIVTDAWPDAPLLLPVLSTAAIL